MSERLRRWLVHSAFGAAFVFVLLGAVLLGARERKRHEAALATLEHKLQREERSMAQDRFLLERSKQEELAVGLGSVAPEMELEVGRLLQSQDALKTAKEPGGMAKLEAQRRIERELACYPAAFRRPPCACAPGDPLCSCP